MLKEEHDGMDENQPKKQQINTSELRGQRHVRVLCLQRTVDTSPRGAAEVVCGGGLGGGVGVGGADSRSHDETEISSISVQTFYLLLT